MPSTYAHYRIGQEILEKVNEKEKRIIKNNIELFNIGLHGPDILFYFNPLFSNSVNEVGYGLHEKSGMYFFKKASVGIKKFETELDRKLLIKDGYDPIRKCLTNHINPSLENAKVISEFFDKVEDLEVEKALKSMIFYNKLLIAPSKLKRKAIFLLLKLTGNYENMHGLFINFESNPKCIDSTLKLLELYDNAKENAIKLINEFEETIRGTIPFNPLYLYNFGSKLIDKDMSSKEAAYEI